MDMRDVYAIQSHAEPAVQIWGWDGTEWRAIAVIDDATGIVRAVKSSG